MEAEVALGMCVGWSQHARYANGGAYPPDLSLITKARHNGQNYGGCSSIIIIVSLWIHCFSDFIVDPRWIRCFLLSATVVHPIVHSSENRNY
jgi:energy-converting hydrogenase Eha subunit G